MSTRTGRAAEGSGNPDNMKMYDDMRYGLTSRLDPRLRGDDERVRGDDERVRGDDERVRGDDERVRRDDKRDCGDDKRDCWDDGPQFSVPRDDKSGSSLRSLAMTGLKRFMRRPLITTTA